MAEQPPEGQRDDLPGDDAIRVPDPRGLLGALATLEHRWKHGPKLYWYVTRPLWRARWQLWNWRYWRAISLLERSGVEFTADGDPHPRPALGGGHPWPARS